jgi:hypothetical protein
LAGRLTHIATVRSVTLRRLRNLAMRILDRVPAFKRTMTLGFSGLGRAQHSVLPQTGEALVPRSANHKEQSSQRLAA